MEHLSFIFSLIIVLLVIFIIFLLHTSAKMAKYARTEISYLQGELEAAFERFSHPDIGINGQQYAVNWFSKYGKMNDVSSAVLQKQITDLLIAYRYGTANFNEVTFTRAAEVLGF